MDKLLAFDFETSLPKFQEDKTAIVGITCASTLEYSDSKAIGRLWYGSTQSDGRKADMMSATELKELYDYMYSKFKAGYVPLGWNSLSFDLAMLSSWLEEFEGAREGCIEMAMNHLDLCFALMCSKGYPVSLAAVAEAMGFGGKTDGLTGDLAPAMWARDRASQEKVLEYVMQDSKLVLRIYLQIMKVGWLEWKTTQGKIRRWAPELSSGRMLLVSEALDLPEPDTSWMTNPRKRGDFLQWTLSQEEQNAQVTDVSSAYERLTLDLKRDEEARVAAYVYAHLKKTFDPKYAQDILDAISIFEA